MALLAAIEQKRTTASKQADARTDAKHKSQFGQFFTPASIARFMAGLFAPTTGATCRLLDAGAGVGTLSVAFIEVSKPRRVELTAFEADPLLLPELDATLRRCAELSPLGYEIHGGDFIEAAVNRLQFAQEGTFTHAILNPPYKKIGSQSPARLLLRQAGIEAVNLYSGFVALALAMLAPGGELVAIIPRSFCNGPYYRPFREFLLARAAIAHIHLFASRDSAFRDDKVLQENVILKLVRDGRQGAVNVSTSTDERFGDLCTHTIPFERIVLPGDPGQFIHIPTSALHSELEMDASVRHSLAEIGVEVSTGPVVDFRLREQLCQQPTADSVALLYPGHFTAHGVQWPRADLKKPNAIRRNVATEKWLYPNGHYCVVRRFSSKEEKRRIVAGVLHPRDIGGAEKVGFENHLNVFHQGRQGLPETLAKGLASYLNTDAVDQFFRRFNGHTQVNATDLRLLKYPSREALMALGEAGNRAPSCENK